MNRGALDMARSLAKRAAAAGEGLPVFRQKAKLLPRKRKGMCLPCDQAAALHDLQENGRKPRGAWPALRRIGRPRRHASNGEKAAGLT